MFNQELLEEFLVEHFRVNLGETLRRIWGGISRGIIIDTGNSIPRVALAENCFGTPGEILCEISRACHMLPLEEFPVELLGEFLVEMLEDFSEDHLE